MGFTAGVQKQKLELTWVGKDLRPTLKLPSARTDTIYHRAGVEVMPKKNKATIAGQSFEGLKQVNEHGADKSTTPKLELDKRDATGLLGEKNEKDNNP